MTATLSANVDKGSGHAPLSTLMARALIRFGDNNPDLMDGTLVHLLLDFANQIVDEVNIHPYRTGMDAIAYYVTPEDVREINDLTMALGIAAHYAIQQGSQKSQTLLPLYYQTLNRALWMELNGNTKIQARPYDSGAYSYVNGQATEE